jgi:[CysO sulfur-carrier protein]-S-L-cysteine hydrolase
MAHKKDVLRISRGAIDLLLAEARANPNIECCGLLGGRDGLISAVLPAKNALQSAKAYEIASEELFVLFRRIRAQALEHLGIYHSHPEGENSPSPLDLERAFYPDAAYLIISPDMNASHPVRAFRIVTGRARELPLEIV